MSSLSAIDAARHWKSPVTRDDFPYRSFWQAGFEGADHVNGSATPLCMNTMTGHVRKAAPDYRRAARMGMRTVRESAGWRQAERGGGGFDFGSVGYRAQCAREVGVQVLWSFMHYGVPVGIDIFSPRFVTRFADYAAALARYLKPFHRGVQPPVYTPINEISFLCWAVCETGLVHPHRGDRLEESYELKKQLVRATLAACDAIWSVEPSARILTVDPLIHVAPQDASSQLEAAAYAEYQFQAWDMLAGRLEPQLGGDQRYLDLLGVNYYPSSQFEFETREMLAWPGDRRRMPLSSLLCALHRRYARPVTVSETSHVGNDRGGWLTEIAGEVVAAQSAGVPVQGVCLYPAIDRPDWEQPHVWHRSGLWHVQPGSLRRSLNRPYANALHRARSLVDKPAPHRGAERANPSP